MQSVRARFLSFVSTKNVAPHFIAVAQIAVASLMFAGISSSFSDMFVLTARLACNRFTTTTTPAPVPPGAQPGLYPSFCSSRLLQSQPSAGLAVSSGYGAIAISSSNPIDNTEAVRTIKYCSAAPASNGTCSAYGSVDSTITSITESLVLGVSRFSCLPSTCFPAVRALLINSQFSGNNVPVVFNGYSGNLPPGLVAGKTYYMRNFNAPGTAFSLAEDQDGPLMKGIGPFQTSIPATTDAFSGCAIQQGSAVNPANFNLDGTIKIPSCGYCLGAAAARMQAGVPALVGTAAALLLLSSLCLLFAPAVTSHRYFPALFGILFSAIPIIFCIAAVAGAAAVYPQNSACAIGLSFGSPAFMTSQFNSSLAALLSPADLSQPPQQFSPVVALQPSTGAALLIAAVVATCCTAALALLKCNFAGGDAQGIVEQRSLLFAYREHHQQQAPAEVSASQSFNSRTFRDHLVVGDLVVLQGLSSADANGCHAVILSLLTDVDRVEVRVTHPADAAVRLAPSVAVRAGNVKRVPVQQHSTA